MSVAFPHNTVSFAKPVTIQQAGCASFAPGHSYSNCGGFSSFLPQGRVFSRAVVPGHPYSVFRESSGQGLGGWWSDLFGQFSRNYATAALARCAVVATRLKQSGAVVARMAHNHEVAGANPASATNYDCRALYEPDARQTAGRDRKTAPGNPHSFGGAAA